MKCETWRRKIHKLWKADEIHGSELIFDSCVLALRYFSVSYWSKDVWLVEYLDVRGITDTRKRRICRDNLIDAYCIIQLFILVGLLLVANLPTPVISVPVYILFEMYLQALRPARL
jgi:hypothetical protein